MAINARDLNRIYSFMRPFVLETVQRFIREGQFTAEDLPAGELVLAGRANPLPHSETHELFGVDELLVDNVSTLCVNRTGVTIPIHSVVFVAGVGFDDDTGESRPSIDLADLTDFAKLPPFGLTREEILDGGEGLVVRLGRVEGFDAATPGFLTPQTLYLDPTTPGGLVNVVPASGTVYRIATVLADESSVVEAESQGELLIAIENLTDLVGGGAGKALFVDGQWGYWSSGTSSSSVRDHGVMQSVTESDASSSQVFDSNGVALRQNTAVGAGSDAGIRVNDDLYRIAQFPLMIVRWRLGQTTNTRFWTGLKHGSASPADADDIGQAGFGIQYSSARGDSNFQFYSDDDIVAPTIVDSGIAVDTLPHFVKIDVLTLTSVRISLLDAAGIEQASTVFTTELPASTKDLRQSSFVGNPSSGAIFLDHYYATIVLRAV